MIQINQYLTMRDKKKKQLSMNLKNKGIEGLLQTKVIKDCHNHTLFDKFIKWKTTSDFRCLIIN